jgi:hypothetical protein
LPAAFLVFVQAAAQPSGLEIRFVDAGNRFNAASGRIGRATRLPLQFGQVPDSFVLAQSAQKVHSKVQIMASAASGARSLSQHSQFGRSSSMVFLRWSGHAWWRTVPRAFG